MLAHALYLCRLNENNTFSVLQSTMTLSFSFCLLFSQGMFYTYLKSLLK